MNETKMTLQEAFDKGLAILAVDGDNGVYVPQKFVERFGASIQDCEYMDIRQDMLECLMGPDGEFYWEAWANIVDGAAVLIDGSWYCIHHDMDVWLVREDVELADD